MSSNHRKKRKKTKRVTCSHCDQALQLRSLREHLVTNWNVVRGEWTSTKHGQPTQPSETPDFRILTRTQMVTNFPTMFETLGITESNWPTYGTHPDMLTDRPRTMRRPLNRDQSDQKDRAPPDIDPPHVNRDQPDVELENDRVMYQAEHPLVDSKPLLKVAHSRHTKFWMALKVWQLTYHISLGALTALLLLITTFTDMLTHHQEDEDMFDESSDFITSYTLHDQLGIGDQHDNHFFTTYSWCNKCSSIYNDSQVIIPNTRFTHICRHVAFPGHPQERFRQPCNTALGSFVKKNGSTIYKPLRPYHYKPLLTQLSAMFKRPHFTDQIEHWRTRAKIDDHWSDVYDGDVWKRYSQPNNILSSHGSLAFLLNVDWFQPFERGTYSCGAIYLVILNLPRHLRYKKENMILLCLLPGGKESEQDLQKLLKPLVNELLLLWTGCLFETPNSPSDILIRGLLLIVSCDLPAARSIAGFKSYNVCCARCHKEFKQYDTGRLNKVGKKIYGYDRSGNDYKQWTPRTQAEARKASREYLNCDSKKKQKEFKTKWCIIYSVLNELPYWNAIEQLVIDPMHCLWMGIAKHVIEQWKANDLITRPDMVKMEQKLKDLPTTRRYGRLRSKLEGNMAQFTAEEMKMFTLVYSLWLLGPILPSDHLTMWKYFVKATTILSRPVLKAKDLEVAQQHLVDFTDAYLRLDLFGPLTWPPNMHFAFHIHEDIQNFGCIYAYHLFALERFNGILESISTDQRSPQTTYIRHISHTQSLLEYPFLTENKMLFSDQERTIWQTVHYYTLSLSFTHRALQLLPMYAVNCALRLPKLTHPRIYVHPSMQRIYLSGTRPATVQI